MKNCGMRLNNNMKGAIFDMDGLLFDTEAVWQKYWKLAAKKRGIELPESFKYDICGTSGEDLYNVIRKYYQTDNPYLIYDETFISYEEELNNNVIIKKGVIEILEAFKNKGYKIAIASSSKKERILKNLNKTNTYEYFDALVSGEEVPIGKPNPEIFLKAANRLGLEPQECYVFEDAYNGVRASYEAGCKTIMIPDLMEPNEEIISKCKIYKSLLDFIEDIE